MGSNDKLTVRQERFAREYTVDGVGSAAATRAGYSPHRAEATASRLLTVGKVASRVKELRKTQLERVDFNADAVLKELANLATQSMNAFVDEDGYVVGSLKGLSKEAIACVQEMTQTTSFDKDGNTVVKQKLKLYDKIKALAVVGNHTGVRAFANATVSESRGDFAARMTKLMLEMRAERKEARARGVCHECEQPLP